MKLTFIQKPGPLSPMETTHSVRFEDELGVIEADVIPSIHKILEKVPLECVRQQMEDFAGADYMVLNKKEHD